MQQIDDPRIPLRFTQSEAKTDAALRNGDLPQWHRNFLNMMWYARIPASVWNDIYLRASKYISLKLLNGEPVSLEPGQIAVIEHLTNIASSLYTAGALPCKDTKAVAGIFKLGVDTANYPAQLEQLQARVKELEAQLPREAPAAPQLQPEPVVPATPELPPEPVYTPEPAPTFEPEPEPVVEPAPVYEPPLEPAYQGEPVPVYAPAPEPGYMPPEYPAAIDAQPGAFDPYDPSTYPRV